MKIISRNISTQCGFVAIAGRPNVGKSTLLNAILGQKLSITCDKPQTTRHRILGIKTIDQAQSIYLDTPGLHEKAGSVLNLYMNKTALAGCKDADVICFVVEALKWKSDDEWVLRRLKRLEIPLILVVNKIDQIKDKKELLPFVEKLHRKCEFNETLMISAQQSLQVETLESVIQEFLPENPFYFSSSQFTDRSERFLAAELVREKLMRFLGDELPYQLTVEIEQFKDEKTILRIAALIWVERAGQKKIIVGDKGEKLKLIGKLARLDMETLFGQKVFLQLWVKEKKGWSTSAKALKSLGYE